MIKAVIFDIDGTLVDSVDLHTHAWQEAFAHFGKNIEYEAIRSQVEKGGDQLIPVFLSKQAQERFGKELDEYRGQLFKSKYLSKVKPFPRLRELVQCVTDDGKQVALASSAKEDEVEIYKRIAHIDNLIEKQTSSDDAEKSKPHPDIFEAALQQLRNVQPEEAVTVGDSPYDAIAAKKLNMSSVGVLSGGFPDKDLRAAGYSEIYRDCADLLEKYQRSMIASRKAA